MLNTTTDVTYEPITRGSYYVIINGIKYLRTDFDTHVVGQVSGLFQADTHDLIIVSVTKDNELQTQTITETKVNKKDKVLTSGFVLQPVNRERMEELMSEHNNLASQPEKQTIKETVAGTTFHPLTPDQKIKIIKEIPSENNIPTAIAQAVLVPEPTNEYDAEAVQVIISLTNGDAFMLGYLPKVSQHKSKIKQPTVAQVTIINYAATSDYSNSYSVEYSI